jgi:hypothetical protein
VTNPPERYEPMPSLAALPGRVWRSMGPRVRIATGIALLGVVALTLVLVPAARESQHRRDAAERREQAERHERLIRKLQAEQRPRFGRSHWRAAAGASPQAALAARARLLEELSAAMLADARGRVRRGALDGPIRRVDCEPFPRSVETPGAEKNLSRRRGRYYCVAVTAEFERTGASIGGALGHPYRAKVDFTTGRYAYCKISGRPDPTPDPRVTTPRACGGT